MTDNIGPQRAAPSSPELIQAQTRQLHRIFSPMKITQQEAEQYKQQCGHYPLIIGHEYMFMGQFVTLIGASIRSKIVTTQTRLGENVQAHVDELGWKQ